MTSSPPLAIEAQSLSKSFGARRAVEGVSFSAAKGEIVALLGPNGAGKTTTMRILAGYTPPGSGRAAIAGHDVAREPMQARARLGYLPESNPLYLDMTVKGYLGFMAEIKRVPRNRRAQSVGESLEECSLADVAGRVIGNLSKGYRQRVGLAQAILGGPEVLILDEPTVGLDPRQIAEIRELIRGMAGRRTVLLSTHILPEAAKTCQRVIIIHNGRIAASGTPDRLDPTQEDGGVITVTLEGDAARARELAEKVAGVRGATATKGKKRHDKGRVELRVETEPGSDPRAELARALVGGGMGLLEMGRAGGTLEEVFLRVISQAGERSADGA